MKKVTDVLVTQTTKMIDFPEIFKKVFKAASSHHLICIAQLYKFEVFWFHLKCLNCCIDIFSKTHALWKIGTVCCFFFYSYLVYLGVETIFEKNHWWIFASVAEKYSVYYIYVTPYIKNIIIRTTVHFKFCLPT